MPTYQYVCTACDHAFEQFQSFSDDSLTVCPRCEGRLRKVFNAVGVVFKGSGFYRNDSRPADKSESAASSNGAADGSTQGSGEKDSGGSGATKETASGSGTSTAKETGSKNGSGGSGPAGTGSSSTGKKARGAA